MTTWTMTFLPIQQVLLNKGKMDFEDLGKKLMVLDPRRFAYASRLEEAINHYVACLDWNKDNGLVTFNKQAKSYTQIPEIYERSVQYELHHTIKDMDLWQLYKLVTKTNSPGCWYGIEWKDLPLTDSNEHFIDSCDFRKGGCYVSCGASDEILKKYEIFFRR